MAYLPSCRVSYVITNKNKERKKGKKKCPKRAGQAFREVPVLSRH